MASAVADGAIVAGLGPHGKNFIARRDGAPADPDAAAAQYGLAGVSTPPAALSVVAGAVVTPEGSATVAPAPSLWS